MELNVNTWIIIGLFIATFIMLLVFYIYIYIVNRKTENSAFKKPIHYSRGSINIDEKKVIIESLSKVREGLVEVYNLDDFIYMLSINPDSKSFRELLKLINNKSSMKNISNKLETIPNSFLTLINFSSKRRSLSQININSNNEDFGTIQFQMQSHELNPKRSYIDMDFFEEDIHPITDSEIFSNLVKSSKNYLSKGVTVIKISPKYSFVETGKDYLINTVQLNAIKRVLLENNIKSYLGRDGSLYSIAPNDRKKNMNTVQKSWDVKIKSLFQKNRNKDFIELDIDDINIDTFILQKKDPKSINEGILFVNLVSDYKRNNYEYEVEDIIFEARSINASGEELVKLLKDKKPPLRVVENVIEERGVKPIHEVYIDYPKEVIDPIIKLSFKHKKDIIESLLKLGNKEAAKLKDLITTVSIDIATLPEIHKVLASENLRKNLYITLPEKERVKHFNYQLLESAKVLKDNNIKTIHFISEYNGANVEMYRIFKSEFILLLKGLNDSAIISDKLKINLKNIENIKEKETKVINIK